MKANTARRQAQRAFPDPKPCEKCGATESVQRHHPDITKPLEIVWLCQACHVAADMADGRWGKGPRPSKPCKVCGKLFTPSHSKKHNTCSRACLSEIGRRNAMKRWTGVASEPPASPAASRTVWTESVDSETPSCPRWPNGSAGA